MKNLLIFGIVALLIFGSVSVIGIQTSVENKNSDFCNVCDNNNDKPEYTDGLHGLSDEEIANYQLIVQENDWSFTVGENSATQYDLEDLCGFTPLTEGNDEIHLVEDDDNLMLTSSAGLPDKFDWREEVNGLPEVRNQGDCGSCWAFATVGALECNIKIHDGEIVDLSEQYLLSCNTDGYGCNGGWWAHDYHQWKQGKLKDGIGAPLESNFPYVAYKSSCKNVNHIYTIENWELIGNSVSVPSVDKIKNAIYNKGPVAVAVYATLAMQLYTGGIFDACSYGSPNHGVVLVGWDDTQGDGVWIMRNSWGKSWGENGYMRIPYDCNNIGHAGTYVEYESSIQEGYKVELEIFEITNDPKRGDFDPIEPIANKPEWYYRIGLTEDSATTKYQFNYNRWAEGFGNWGWNSYYSWQPEEIHTYYVDDITPEITIKLMDDDQFILEGYKDDLADISAYEGGGVKDGADQEERCAIYHCTYNLATDKISGDTITGPDSNGYYTTVGDGNDNALVKFKITDDYVAQADLDCEGSLSWSQVSCGQTVSSSFFVKNVGDDYSSLNWEIESYPNWGTWTFTPNSGSDLTPEDGKKTISVKVVAPNEQEQSFSGNIKIVNSDDSNDYCTISVSLTTPKIKSMKISILKDFMPLFFRFINLYRGL